MSTLSPERERYYVRIIRSYRENQLVDKALSYIKGLGIQPPPFENFAKIASDPNLIFTWAQRVVKMEQQYRQNNLEPNPEDYHLARAALMIFTARLIMEDFKINKEKVSTEALSRFRGGGQPFEEWVYKKFFFQKKVSPSSYNFAFEHYPEFAALSLMANPALGVLKAGYLCEVMEVTL